MNDKMLELDLEFFKCGDCGVKFGRPFGPGRKPSRCPQCRESYERNYNTKWNYDHRKAPMVKDCVCEKCGLKFQVESVRRWRYCPDCRRKSYNESVRNWQNRSKGKAMISIVNIAKKLTKTGLHPYQLKINGEVIATFYHRREQPLHIILKKAAEAAKAAAKEKENV